LERYGLSEKLSGKSEKISLPNERYRGKNFELGGDNMKDIAIVIVNYKMKDLIDRCLETLFHDVAHSNLNIEIIVVDNHSEDGVDTLLAQKYPSVRFIPQDRNPGFGTSQNVGLSAADARYYFILNPDTEFLPGQQTLTRLSQFMDAHPKVGMVGPKIVYPDGSLQYSCWRFPSFLQPLYNRTTMGKYGRGKKLHAYHMMIDFDHEKTMPVDAIMGSAMFVRRKALKEVGMFDEQFWMYFEDIDLSMRMWEAHWPVYYVHDIVLQHLHGRGSAKVPGILNAFFKNKLFRVHIKSWLRYMWKWRGHRTYYLDTKHYL